MGSTETIKAGQEEAGLPAEQKDTVTGKPERSAKPRMPEQDIAKGIAILLVMALHTLTLNKDIYLALGGIFGFIMPFFFFMAGYNHRPYRYSYKEIIRKRVRQILVPFFTYSVSITLIAGVYYMIAEGYTVRTVVNSYLTLLLTRPLATSLGVQQTSGLYNCIMVGWFIIMLFTASLIFYAVVDFALSAPSRFLSVFVGLIVVTMIFAHFDVSLPLHICEAPAVAAIMLLGALAGQKELLAGKRPWWIILINSLVAYAFFVVLALMFQGAGFMSGGSLWNKSLKEWTVPLSVVFSIVGTYPFVHFCRCLIRTGVICKALVWCGNQSMRLLFLHGIVQLFVCAILGLEPFRMSFASHENDFRTFYVLALEILGSVLVIRSIDFVKNLLKKKKTASPS